MSRKSLLIVFCLFSFLLFGSIDTAFADSFISNSASAEVSARFGEWQNVGPNGGDVRSIVVDPANSKHFYFSTLDGQIYTSNDSGNSWRLLTNFNRPQLILDSMLIDSRDSKTIYVGGHRHKEPGGFFKSTDGGLTWREAKDLQKHPIYAITQSATNPDMLLVGTYEGVYVSYDSGNNWKRMADEKDAPGLVNVESLAIDPRNADIIYAGTWYRPYKTTDGGKTWRLISQGMIDDSDVFAINIDQSKPEHIIASACSGIYETFNSGENWKKIQGIPSTSRRTRDILQHPSKPGYVYAGTTEGFWMSSDGGASWSVTTSKQLEINSITIHPSEPNKIYIGTNNYGVMVSNDFGKTFAQTNAGFSTRQTISIISDLEQPNRFYASTINTATGGGFFFVSTDGGATWQAAMKNFPARLTAYTIFQSPASPNTIYIGTSSGLYRSLDRGASWAALPTVKTIKAPVRRTRATAAKTTAATKKSTSSSSTAKKSNSEAAPRKPTVFVANLTEKVNEIIPTNDGKNGILVATDKGLYRSYDVTKGWDKFVLPEDFDARVLTVGAASSNAQTIWVGTARSGVLSTHDGGVTWKQETEIPTQYPISRIEVDQTDGNRVFVGTMQTLFMTKDNGENWERRGGGLPAGNYNSIVINPSNSNEIFAGSAQENRDGLFYSADGGKSWERVDVGNTTLASRRIWALSFDSHNPSRLLIGSHSAGIYRIERNQTASAQN